MEGMEAVRAKRNQGWNNRRPNPMTPCQHTTTGHCTLLQCRNRPIRCTGRCAWYVARVEVAQGWLADWEMEREEEAE